MKLKLSPTSFRSIVKNPHALTAAAYLLLILLLSPFEAAARIAPHPQLEHYLELDAQESRYAEYQDSPEVLNLKLHQLDYINLSRTRYGVQKVALDILASRVANRMAREACEGEFTGHWNLRGEKPYHRYAFAGGTDHVAENAAAYWSSAPLPASSEAMGQYMRDSHDRFMAEVAPRDGHKQNCIHPAHNFLGIGVALIGKHFRYYEEFIDRYLEVELPEGPLKVNTDFSVKFRPLEDTLYPYAVIAYYERYPSPMTAAQVERKGSYPDYTSKTAMNLWPWEFESDDAGWVDVRCNFRWKGLYYLQFYLDENPYTGGTSANTRGKLQASGVVIHIP